MLITPFQQCKVRLEPCGFRARPIAPSGRQSGVDLARPGWRLGRPGRRLGPRVAAAAQQTPLAEPELGAGPRVDAVPAKSDGVGVCHVSALPPQPSLAAALQALRAAVEAVPAQFGGTARGLVRLEVPVPRSVKALWWLRGQGDAAETASLLHPRVYFSPRRSSAPDTPGSQAAAAASAGAGSVAGAGAAWLWRGPPGAAVDEAAVASMQRFLASGPPRVRVFGGARFSAARAPAPEWEPFGAYYFVLPRVEYTEAAGCGLLACNVAWDADLDPADAGAAGFPSLAAAAADALAALAAVRPPAAPCAGAINLRRGPAVHSPDAQGWAARLDAVHEQLQPAVVAAAEPAAAAAAAAAGPASTLSPDAALNEFLRNGQQGLDQLLAALDGGFEAVDPGAPGDGALTKVVLARRSDVALAGRLEPLELLEALQERDPRAYQVALQLPSGQTFVASTPERLYARTGDAVASEAVAGTRARGAGGDVEKDFWLAFDLLRSPKDHVEFGVVRAWVERALRGVCEDVVVEVSKSVLKQGSVQHLYGRLAGRLRAGRGDAQLLAALHPTPAVCGQPRGAARDLVEAAEPFDRGFYAGPFGWLSDGAAEFAVAIRSALVQPGGGGGGGGGGGSGGKEGTTAVSLYAGVGIVSGSDTASEWAELDLKVAQYERLLAAAPPLAGAPNVGALRAAVVVEELCRRGCNTFCVAPGSRSSPLTAAIAAHPRARVVPCIDERSLGFWALGHARACGRPAVVVTSSGTAVANLLPAVVEASQSNVPMLLLTADRPAALRGTGANQTIDQVGIFGGYVRAHRDLPPPSDRRPAGEVLGWVAAAVERAGGEGRRPPGPVHLNCQFEEPLAPAPAPWDPACLEGLQEWEASGRPFRPAAAPAPPGGSSAPAAGGAAEAAAFAAVAGAQRGLLVLGEQVTPEEVHAAVQLAQALGWPVAADALSGLRAGAHAAAGPPLALLPHWDHMLLLDREHWHALRPDVVLQVGGHLTSKRTAQFLEWCAAPPRPQATWLFAARCPGPFDQGPLVTHRLFCDALPALVAAQALAGGAQAPQLRYTALLVALEAEVSAAVHAALDAMPELCEPEVARVVTQELPPGEGLFVGNSMPVRDVDMFCRPAAAAAGAAAAQGAVPSGVGAPVAANRGASGIDGVLSTAAGFAEGLGRGCTLLVGDISFLHDINGLNLLRSGEMRSPLTTVLVNNGGGGIFSFLPVAEALPEEVFTPLWATPQHVDLQGMCRAHGIPHMRVSSAQELRAALRAAWGLNRHSVVEVTTDRRTNVERHREVQRAAQRAASDALRVFSAAMVSAPTFAGCSREAARSFFLPVVAGAAYYRFALPLAKPLTAGAGDGGVRRGMRLQIWLTVGCLRVLGEGEVSPLPGLHAETLAQAEQQVAALCELLVGVTVPMSTALLGGRFAAWLARGVGVPAEGLLPSVRCGLEAALLSALASPAGGSLAKVLNAAAGGSCSSLPSRPALGPGGAAVNALLDCRGGPAAAAAEAESLVAAGFTTLKLKVARQADPLADAAAVLAVRQAVGPAVVLRADANQRWSLQEAVQFGAAAAPARLQYVEEPVAGGADGAAAFFLATGVHTALDESIDQGRLDTAQPLPAGVAALVLKPSSLGGFERALQLAAWARAAGAAAVISSAFESPAGLQQLGALAAAVDPEGVTHHGLATQDWFCEAAQIPELLGPKRSRSPRGVVLGQLIPRRVQLFGREAGTAAAAERRLEVSTAAGDFGFRLLEVSPPGSSSNNSDGNGKGSSTGSSTGISGNGAGAAASAPRPAVVFLHGFLGSADEWAPHMHALASSGRRCVALDLPGHGATTTTMGAAAASGCSLPAAAEAVAALLQRAGLQGCTLVGYSLGARLALAVAARRPELAGRVVAVSGTPGIEAAGPRAARAARDDGVAESLRRGGVQAFVRRWYQQPMWASLRAHPRFASVAAARARQPGGAAALGAALSAMSPGRAPAVWAELEAAAAAGSLPPLLLVAGALDPKFVGVAERLEAALNARRAGAAHAATLPGCGHAAHLERPLELLRLLADFV